MTRVEKVIVGIVGAVIGLGIIINLIFFFIGTYLALKELMRP